MKAYIYILIGTSLFLSMELFSQDTDKKEEVQASQTFRRLMEISHPSPRKRIFLKHLVPQSNNTKNSIFLNVNTIDEEVNQQYKMQNESSISINPLNRMNLIASAVDYRDNSATWVYVSADGGRNWVNHNLGRPYPNWRSTNDPSVAFDADGVGYLVYGGHGTAYDSLGLSFGENGVFIAKSVDEGKTWKAHIPVIVHLGKQSLDSNYEDKYYITVDNSPNSPYFKHIYIPWKRVVPRDSSTTIVISKSTDKGETWSEPIAISERFTGSSEDTTYGQSFPLAATGPNGEVYVVWNNGIEHAVGFVVSYDGGDTWSEPRMIFYYDIFGETRYLEGQGWRHSVKKTVRSEAYPVIQCDLSNSERRGWLYLTWAADNYPNIYFSRSTDHGQTWSDRVIVHSDTKNDQFWQWHAVDPSNGDIAVMYLDSRNDPENIAIETYVSYSSDGGNTWIDKMASDVSSDIRLNPFTANSFAGDYNGLAFLNGIIYPSWVDMRNAEKDIFDSDVFAAFISVNAPEAVDSFIAKTIPTEPDKIQLTWTAPETRSFNQTLLKDDFHYSLFRDDIFLIDISSDEINYLDEGLVAYNKYNYKLFVVSGQDTSSDRKASAFAGGSPQPATPIIENYSGNENNEVLLKVKIPNTREDGVTPLVNLSKIAIYRDGQLVNTISALPTDTGRVVEVLDNPSELGYYRYSVSLLDDANPSNESNKSNEVLLFTGKIEIPYFEAFNGDELPKFLKTSEWGTASNFFKSSPHSLSESPDGFYSGNMNYVLQFFPIIAEISERISFSFYHAAIVEKKDSCLIEISKNNSAWELLGFFDKTHFLPWEDSVLNQDDWKLERYLIDLNPDDTLLIRFRLKSNVTRHEDGWYIDDLSVSEYSSVKELSDAKSDFILYPNPAQSFLNCSFENSNAYLTKLFKIYNLFGTEILVQEFYISDKFITINIDNLASGVYIFEIENQGLKKQKIFTKIK